MLNAQDGTVGYRNFPIIISVQFHSISLPFQRIKSNFSNIGIGIGTEVSFGGKDRWVQQLQTVWYRNKAAGNGLLFYTQTAWRPRPADDFYAEAKLGVGYMIAQRPTPSFHFQENNWISVGHKGKGMLAIPIGLTVGYEQPTTETYISPFLGYQFLVVAGYNKSIPVMPQTLLQPGVRIHFKD